MPSTTQLENLVRKVSGGNNPVPLCTLINLILYLKNFSNPTYAHLLAPYPIATRFQRLTKVASVATRQADAALSFVLPNTRYTYDQLFNYGHDLEVALGISRQSERWEDTDIEALDSILDQMFYPVGTEPGTITTNQLTSRRVARQLVLEFCHPSPCGSFPALQRIVEETWLSGYPILGIDAGKNILVLHAPPVATMGLNFLQFLYHGIEVTFFVSRTPLAHNSDAYFITIGPTNKDVANQQLLSDYFGRTWGDAVNHVATDILDEAPSVFTGQYSPWDAIPETEREDTLLGLVECLRAFIITHADHLTLLSRQA